MLHELSYDPRVFDHAFTDRCIVGIRQQWSEVGGRTPSNGGDEAVTHKCELAREIFVGQSAELGAIVASIQRIQSRRLGLWQQRPADSRLHSPRETHDASRDTGTW